MLNAIVHAILFKSKYTYQSEEVEPIFPIINPFHFVRNRGVNRISSPIYFAIPGHLRRPIRIRVLVLFQNTPKTYPSEILLYPQIHMHIHHLNHSKHKLSINNQSQLYAFVQKNQVTLPTIKKLFTKFFPDLTNGFDSNKKSKKFR